MLDIFLISDNDPKPNIQNKNRLEYIGGLDYETFESLQKKKLLTLDLIIILISD